MEHVANCLHVCSPDDIDRYLAQIRDAATKIQTWIVRQDADPLELLRRMKFETGGSHPILGHPLNVIEQINQTWTFLVALAAARHLLEMHPESGGFLLAPGAHAAIALDIMSLKPGLVGAETFAAVNPANNKKLKTDLLKLATRTEQFRYVFFMSPRFPGFKRLPKFEVEGIQVWSVDV
jgi:hypothetical protein